MIRQADADGLAPGTPVLVDTNVLLDVFTVDAEWFAWSSGALASASETRVLVLNPIVYAEVSVEFPSIEELDDALPLDRFRREDLPWDAGFVAGKAFRAYRRRGGPRRSPLPDFYIGAHAAVAGLTLLTRDPKRYRTYFPTVIVVSP